jgi:hypothetical protein
MIATYMWDTLAGGVPLAPLETALKSMGKNYARMSSTASKREVMQTLWQDAGLQAIETRQIRIPVTYSSLDDFCESNLVPVGPAGQILKAMSASEIEQLKDRLHEILPIAPDGRIAYEAFANAIKGKVPA